MSPLVVTAPACSSANPAHRLANTSSLLPVTETETNWATLDTLLREISIERRPGSEAPAGRTDIGVSKPADIVPGKKREPQP
jgi:hypothetical protein